MTALRSRKVQGLLGLLSILVAAGLWCWSQRAAVKPDNVQIGISTNLVRMSWKTFSYNEAGHFANKTQFESRYSDKAGGSYSLHCRDGKVYAVEISYPSGLDKVRSLEVVERILRHKVATAVEKDDEELSLKGCPRPSEYFYFEDGRVGAQVEFSDPSAGKVNRVYCWMS